MTMTNKLRSALVNINKEKLKSISYLHFKEQLEIIDE